MYISEKIKWLLGFCSEYIDHAEQYDERQNVNDKFHIDLGVEHYIKNSLPDKHLILLTGDAGDGKTRTLFNMSRYLDKSWEYINDFSEYDSTNRESILTEIIASLKAKTQKYIIAANSGIFFNSVIQYNKHELLNFLNDEKVSLILNFNSRNLALKLPGEIIEDTKFYKIITEYLDISKLVSCNGCPLSEKCPFLYNIYNLTKPSVIEGIRILLDTLYLMGMHITFRDLLSVISYFVTKAKNCDDVVNSSDLDQYYYFNNIFCYDGNNNKLLSELSRLDVAKKDISEFDHNLFSCEDYSRINVDFRISNIPIEKINQIKRHLFFTSPSSMVDSYDSLYYFLPVKYVNEFRNLLDDLKKNQYIEGMNNAINSIITRFELGLNKISNPDQSDAQLILFDSPPLITKNVRLEYSSRERLQMLLCTADFYNSTEENQKKDLEDINQFYCFAFCENETFKNSPTIKINYKLFEQIMLAQDNIFSIKTANISDNANIVNFTKSIFDRLKVDSEISIKWIGTQEKGIDNFDISFIKQPNFRNTLPSKNITKKKISISYVK